MRQTERISSSSSRSSSFNFRCFEWSAILLLLTLAPSLTLTQYASSAYSSQFYGNNHQQVQQQLQQQLQPRRYPDAPLTYTYQYPAADVQSVWSSAPIVVNDEANSLELERQRQQQRQQRQQEQSYLPINYYNNRELDRRQTNWIHNNNNNKDDYYVPTTRAANHNYNNVPGYFYYPQTQTQPQSQQELEQRELLSAADSRRDEEQIVRIGGIQSLALNPRPKNNNNNAYYEPSQPWRRNNLEAQYAQHYSDYLRKYPQRLQPLYNSDK